MVDNYPKISQTDAADLLELHKNNELSQDDLEQRTTGSFDQQESKETVALVLDRLLELAEISELSGSKKYSLFESQASNLLHEEGHFRQSWIRDIAFWRWLTFSNQQTGAWIIDARYGSTDNPGTASEPYYGLGRINESYLCYLWHRANNSVDISHESDIYWINNQLTDVDFWWSHVLRVELGCYKTILREFARFVIENEVPRGEVNDPDVAPGFRDLARELTRRSPTTCFEAMNSEDAKQFISHVWKDRTVWSQK